MIRFSFTIGCSESKVIFKWRKENKQIKRLYKEQTFAPRAFHSVSVRNLKSQSVRKARLEPAIRDAQNLAHNVFPPWKSRVRRTCMAVYTTLPLWQNSIDTEKSTKMIFSSADSYSAAPEPARVETLRCRMTVMYEVYAQNEGPKPSSSSSPRGALLSIHLNRGF